MGSRSIPRSHDVLTDMSQESLAAAVELNAAELVRLQGRLPWVEWHEKEDVQWLFAGDRWPRNSVGLARFSSESADRRIGEILAYHIDRGAACNWVVGALSHSTSLVQELRRHKFRCMIHCAAMACDLSRVGASAKPAAEVTIRLEENAPALMPLTTERRQLRQRGRTAMARFNPQQIWHFAASVKGRAIGEVSIGIGAGVAGLFDVEVLENFRGKGIGTALVQAAVRHARSLGYRIAVLGATGMGQAVYQRVGFQEVGKLSFFKYGKGQIARLR